MREDSGSVVTTDAASIADYVPFAPIQQQFPRIDDHLVKPEVSRFELIRGREVDVSGADPPHADAQARLAFLIMAHVVAGFVVSTELLTRVAHGSDFATDVCVRKDGIDPRRDTRYLEEVAFEIVNKQKKRDVTDKAEDMVCRGVRRAFAIFVRTGQVCEWSAAKGKFIPFDRNAVITDRVFVRPVAVQALLDQAAGEDAAALALIAKRNPALVKHRKKAEKKAEKKGRKKGLAEGLEKGLDEGLKKGLDEGLGIGRDLLLAIVKMRYGNVSTPIRQRIEAADARAIQAWGQKLLAGSPIEELFTIP